MTDTELNRRPKPFSARLAAAVVVVVGLGAAASISLRGVGLALVAFAGTALFVRGVTMATGDPDETSNRRWALASLAVAVGLTVAILPAFRYWPSEVLLVYPFVIAHAFAGVASTGALAGDRSHHLSRLCWRCRDALGAATVLSVFLHLGVFTTLSVDSWKVMSAVVTGPSLLSLLFLEVLAVLVLVAVPRAQAVLEEEVATPEARRIAQVTIDGKRVDAALPAIRRRLVDYWWLFAAQIVLLVTFPGLITEVLLAVPGFGPALVWLLESGVVHLSLLALVSVASLVIVAGLAKAAVVGLASVDPPRILASAVGGVVLGLAVMIPGHLLADGIADVLFAGTTLEQTASVYGPVAIVLGSLTVVTFLLPIAFFGADMFVSASRLATPKSGGFLVAGILALAGSVVAAVQGAPALLVFAGVAASLLTWELGFQASYLGTSLGAAVQTREVEVVHAVGALAVGVAGILVASLAGYVIGPVSLPTGSDQAYVALALALLSALSFVLALE